MQQLWRRRKSTKYLAATTVDEPTYTIADDEPAGRTFFGHDARYHRLLLIFKEEDGTQQWEDVMPDAPEKAMKQITTIGSRSTQHPPDRTLKNPTSPYAPHTSFTGEFTTLHPPRSFLDFDQYRFPSFPSEVRFVQRVKA